MSIGAVSFRGEEQQKKSSALPVATTLAGGAIGAFAIKEKITGKDVIKNDTFELKGKKIADEDKDVVTKINAKLADLKEEKLGTTADAKVTDKFNGKETLTAEEYLGKTPDDFKAAITAKEGETAALQTTFDEKKAAFDKADEAGKAAAKTEKETAEKALKAHKNAIAADKAELEFATKAKDGVTKDAFKTKAIADIKGTVKNEVDDLLATLKKVPKKVSVKMGLIAAGVGLVLGVLLSGSGKKEAPAEEAKA